MSGNLLATNTVSLSDLLSGEKRFEVPLYQRDYSWTEEHWEDLWNDVLEVSGEPDTKHYMGSLVLQQHQERRYRIIDGQQRITTLSIFVISVLTILKELIDRDNESSDNMRRAQIIRQRFIGDEDPSSLRYSSKLRLNNNNNDIFERFLIQLETPRNLRSFNSSSKLILKCRSYFKDKILEYAGDNLSGEFIVNFLTNEVARKLIFIQIEVEDELSAYTVFETLNARGVELSSSDLLKNYLFSLLVSSTDQEIIQRQWDKICLNVKSEDLPDFLRYYINSSERLVRSHQLFKRIKSNIRTAGEAQQFLNDLEVESEVFMAFKDPNSEFWNGDAPIKKYLRSIKLFGSKQVFPLLLASYRKLTKPEFTRICKMIETILFRYSVIGKLNPNSLETVLNRAAVLVHQEELTTARAVFNELRDVYVDDGEFTQSFEKTRIVTKNRKKIVRYILFKIENSIRPSELDWETSNASIEHILPENPSDDWSEYVDPNIQEEYIYKLGNYTLLSPSENRNIGNELLAAKLSTYQDSDYNLSSEITEEVWTHDSIDTRQRRLSTRARSIWRSDFDS